MKNKTNRPNKQYCIKTYIKTVFVQKTLPSFLQIQEKLETFRNSNLTNFRGPFF